jgi:regulatory protein
VAWGRALRWLAAHDHSTQELRARLAAVGVPATVIERTLERLAQAGYLDDARFAQGAAERAARLGHGSDWIRADLAEKGIAAAVIEAAVGAAFADEPAIARRALARRFRTPAHTATDRARAARFLLTRGFPEAVVLAILGEGC